ASGVLLGDSYRHLIFVGPAHSNLPFQTIEVVTGLIYAVIGPTQLGGFLVYAWLGFLGLVLFYRAFRIAFPEGDHRRYARFLFLLPSLLFWPSSIGKDAWMVLMLGIAAYGAARVLSRQPTGFILCVLGLY